MSKTADNALGLPPQPDCGFVHFPCGHLSYKTELESARFSECLSCQITRGKENKRQARIEALEWVLEVSKHTDYEGDTLIEIAAEIKRLKAK